MVLNLDPCHVQVLHCSHCQFLTLSVSRLLEHCHTHRQSSGIVFYQCEACGLVGTHESLLIEHAKAWHKDINPVPVKILSRSTVSNEALATSACAFCDFVCTDSESGLGADRLSDHYRTQHNVKNVSLGMPQSQQQQHDQARPEGDPDLGVAAVGFRRVLDVRRRPECQQISLQHRSQRVGIDIGAGGYRRIGRSRLRIRGIVDDDDDDDEDGIVDEDRDGDDEVEIDDDDVVESGGVGSIRNDGRNGVDDDDFGMPGSGGGVPSIVMQISASGTAANERECMLPPSHGLTLNLLPDGPPPSHSRLVGNSAIKVDEEADEDEATDDAEESSTTVSGGMFGGGGSSLVTYFGDDDDAEADYIVAKGAAVATSSASSFVLARRPAVALVSSTPTVPPLVLRHAKSRQRSSGAADSAAAGAAAASSSSASPIDDEALSSTAAGCQLKCDKCEMVFGSAKALNHHQSRAHGARGELCCAECRTRFETTFSLQEHTLLVHGRIVELWGCDVCQRVFTHLSSMRRHKRLAHSNQKLIHVCGKCGMVFSRKDKLLLHHRRHVPCSQRQGAKKSNKKDC